MRKIQYILSFASTLIVSLLSAQVPTYAPLDNLIAWYNFNGDVLDASGNGHNGSTINTTATTDRQGQADQAFHFDGVSSDILVPYSPAFNAYPLTVSVWVRTEDDDNGGMIIQHYANASWNGWVMSVSGEETQTIAPGYMLDAPPNCNGVVSNAACATGINYTGDVYDNHWHMLTFSVDADSGRFYFDGVLQTTQAWTGNPGAPTNTDDLHIGGTDLGSNFMFHGSIDEVGLWNRALTDLEIETLYLGMPPVAGCMNSNACNYAPEASVDDGSCTFNCAGCVDPCACNYDQNAVVNDGTCDYSCNQAMSFITVFHDANGNGVYENDETPIQHWPVYFDELDKTVYTNLAGMIIVPLPAGTIHYTLLNPTDNWINTTPDNYTIEVPGSTVAFFGLMETTPSTEIDASIIEAFYQDMHCDNGFESGLFVRNQGSLAAHGTLTLTCDPLLTPQVAASLSVAPTTAGAGFATWEIDNLAAWQPQLLAFSIAGPGSEYAGQSFAFSLHLTLYDDAGAIVIDEFFELTPEVSCDTEDSHINPTPLGFTDQFHYVNQGERITFRTHFLNSTEATAQDVLVIHNLNSQQFVTDSFELLYTSAAVVGCLHDDGTIDLSFNSIQLPSVMNNPANAMGYAVYSAQLRDDLPVDSTFYHEAYAVFDLSETLLIDSAYHTIYDCNRLLGIEGDNTLCEGDSLHLEAQADSAATFRWFVEDSLITTGRTFSNLLDQGQYIISLFVSNPVCEVNDSKEVNVYPLPVGEIHLADTTLSVSGIDSCQWYFNNTPLENQTDIILPLQGDGVYQALLFGEGDCASWSNEFVVNNVAEKTEKIDCYPNPATHILQLSTSSPFRTLRLSDMMGVIVWQSSSTMQQQCIDVSSYSRGCYCLQVEYEGHTSSQRIVLQ